MNAINQTVLHMYLMCVPYSVISDHNKTHEGNRKVAVDLVKGIHREAILLHETFIPPNSPRRTFEW